MALLTAILCAISGLADAQPVEAKHVTAELVSEVASIRPGDPFWVAVHLDLDDGWHVYWQNPGDSGLPPEIAWDLPAGFEAGPIQWPYPHRIAMDPLVDYGYDGEVYLLTEITPPGDLPAGAPVTLRAEVMWLVCEDVCIPGEAGLRLDLPVRAEPPRRNDAVAAAFDRVRSQLPRVVEQWAVSASERGDAIHLRLTPTGAGLPALREIAFFPADAGHIQNAAPQRLRETAGGYELILQRSHESDAALDRVRGVLVHEAGWGEDGAPKAMRVDVPLREDAAPPAVAASGAAERLSLAAALGFAYLGGLILNLMPCVFPVLSIKILGFVQQAGDAPARIRRHGLLFGLGVLMSFWALAGALIALRAGGAELGWGFQLQSPTFVVVLSFVLFAVALNLLGVFEIGGGLVALAGRATGGNGYSGSFASGVLATVLATPCTAPFMGAALAYALTLPAATALAVFSALGLGMASPYVLLSYWPRLIARLPRPGPWMETFKQAMAFPLLATGIWLAWVLAQQTGSRGVIGLLIGLFLVGLGAWSLGTWATPVRRLGVRLAARVLAAACLVLGFYIAVPGEGATAVAAPASAATERFGLTWHDYSAELIEELQAARRPILVDFTAAWCLTCQVNERVAFGSSAVQDKLADLDVALVRADWTSRDPAITRALEAHGRSGVPLYVLYDGAGNPPSVLPEILSPGIVLDALETL